MQTLLLGKCLPRRVLTLLAVLILGFLTVVIAVPSHAAAAVSNSVTKGDSTHLSAVLDMRTVPKVMGANGTLQCDAGDYARATNKWTNAYGQSLAVGMYVGVSSICEVRFREHLVASGSNGCDFNSDNAAIWESDWEPPNITRSNSLLMGHANYTGVRDSDCDHWFTGVFRSPDRNWIISSDNQFRVTFLSPYHTGVNHAGCSQALSQFSWTSYPNYCFYY